MLPIIKIKSIKFSIFMLSVFLCALPFTLAAYKASDFNWAPPFISGNEIPSVTIILDSSRSMHRMAYAKIVDENTPGFENVYKTYGSDYNSSEIYYGYFDSTKKYKYNQNGYFEINNTDGDWNGNFMNWATMHRIDVMRKALTGGNYTENSTGIFYEVIKTNRLKTDKNAYQTADFRDVIYKYNSTTPGVVPDKYATSDKAIVFSQDPDTITLKIYNSTNNPRTNSNAKELDSYILKIKTPTVENGIFDEYKETGGKVKARFSLFRYYPAKANTSANEHGGAKILAYMSGTNATIEKIKYEINTLMPSGAAPLAEALYTSVGYIQQFSSIDQDNGPRYNDDAFIKTLNATGDPFYFPDLGMVSCTQQNVIFITPGESTFGDQVPVGKTNIIPSIDPYRNLPLYTGAQDNKYYILDTSKWAHETDLRASTDNALNGLQNINLFILAAFGKNDILLQDAAWYGGSKVMKNISGIPHQVSENYFEAESGTKLKDALEAIFAAATRGTMSGTAAAVTSQTRSGEGAVYQALFFPPTNSTDSNRIGPDWSGQVHALLVDSQGRMREDTNLSRSLDSGDKIIEFTNDLIVRRSLTNSTYETLNNTQEINFLWSSTDWLNSNTLDPLEQRPLLNYKDNDNRRYIFTSVNNIEVPFVSSSLNVKSNSHFSSYLTLWPTFADKPSTANNLTDGDSVNNELAKRQINFIRGQDQINATLGSKLHKDNVRSRSFKNKTWRLGDIVYSSPTIVGSPSENYHILYRDNTYKNFYTRYKNRRQMIYTGANDGMLHAFNGGFYTNSSNGFSLSLINESNAAPLGMEMWAYIPFNLLPHLRWLMEPEYGAKLHVPYMDLKPRIFDARIFTNSNDNSTYPDGWGTVLVAGMRFGGGLIEVDTDKNDIPDHNSTSAYVILDITNPEAPPKLLGEITMPGLGFTTCYPTVMPMTKANTSNDVENNWYLVFGSGPADADGFAKTLPSYIDRRSPALSAQTGKIYILDLKKLANGGPISTLNISGKFSDDSTWFATTESNSFISDPIAVDVDFGSRNLNTEFKTDIVYYGTTSGSETYPRGTMRRILTFNDNNNTTVSWRGNSTLINTDKAITSAANVAMDEQKNLWVYFGSGRFYNRADIPQTIPMTFYGIKDPVYNGTTGMVSNEIPTKQVTSSLYNSTAIELTNESCPAGTSDSSCITVHGPSGATMTWQDLLNAVANTPGWRYDFVTTSPHYERVLGQSAVFGGAVLFTSYRPDTDICIFEGTSQLYALYYKTGTAYFEPILRGGFDKFTTLGKGLAITPSIHLGQKGTTAYVQTSSGAIKTIEIIPPLNVQSGVMFWRKNTN